jgi:hypothetical protein
MYRQQKVGAPFKPHFGLSGIHGTRLVEVRVLFNSFSLGHPSVTRIASVVSDWLRYASRLMFDYFARITLANTFFDQRAAIFVERKILRSTYSIPLSALMEVV